MSAIKKVVLFCLLALLIVAGATNLNFSKPTETTDTKTASVLQSSSCPSGYYWNGSNCVAGSETTYPTSTSCGSGYYWNGSNCVPETQTTPTATSCPSGYYWDSTANNCLQSPTYQSCSSGYYWDTSSNTCKPNPTSSSCGSGYFWDSGTGTCKPNPTSTSSSCGSGYTWNGSYCAPSTSSSGTGSTSCSSGYTWNGSYCASSTTTNPSTSCSNGTYWNGSSCVSDSSASPTGMSCPSGWTYSATAYIGFGGCIQSNNGTITCGMGYSWNGTNCISSSAGANSTYTGTTYTTTYNPYTNVESKIADCWKNKIGQSRFDAIKGGGTPTSTEYQSLNSCYSQTAPITTTASTLPSGSTYSMGGLRYPNKSSQSDCISKILGSSDYSWFNNMANPSATGEYQRFENMMRKIQNCFGSATIQFNSIQEPRFFIPPLMASCLQEVWGQARYSEISANNSAPTPEERGKSEACYTKVSGESRPQVQYQTSEKLDDNTQSCLKLAVGAARFEAISAGKSQPTPDEMTKGNTCFGAVNSAIVPPTSYKVDSKVDNCVKSSFDLSRLTSILSGQSTPTTTEKEKITQCFKSLNKIQKTFLPLPPTQIPFLETDNSTAVVLKTETKYTKSSSGKEKPVVTFKGKSLPNKTVDLYLFSDPIVVTLKTDANGEWSYDLDTSLQPGDHAAYIAVKSGTEAVRSEVFRFSIAQAAETTDRQGGLIVATPKVSTTTQNYLYWVIGLIVVGVLGVFGLLILLKRRQLAATNL